MSKSWFDLTRMSGKPSSTSSIAGTLTVPCTQRKWAESTEFSAISCGEVRIFQRRRYQSLKPASLASGILGSSHMGAAPSGWYHAHTKPSSSCSGSVATFAFLLVRSL